MTKFFQNFEGNPSNPPNAYNPFEEMLPPPRYSDGTGTLPEKEKLDSGRWTKLTPSDGSFKSWQSLIGSGLRNSQNFPRSLKDMARMLERSKEEGNPRILNVSHWDRDYPTHTRYTIPAEKIEKSHLPGLEGFPEGYTMWSKKPERKQNSTTKPNRVDLYLLGHPGKVMLKSYTEVLPHIMFLYLMEHEWFHGKPCPEGLDEKEWKLNPRSKPAKDIPDWTPDYSLCPCPGCISITKKATVKATVAPSAKPIKPTGDSRRVIPVGHPKPEPHTIPGKAKFLHMGEGHFPDDDIVWWDSEDDEELIKKRKTRHFILRELGMMPPLDTA